MTTKPLALILDDDPDFLQIAALQLQRLGFRTQTVDNTADFLMKVPSLRPDVCLVDLNIGPVSAGFDMVEDLRRKYQFEGPLFIVSAISDARAIAHAIEVGASDFIVKPLDREVLASKLSVYFNSAEISEHKLSYLQAPSGGDPARVTTELEIVGLDELGINLTGRTLFIKGIVVWLSGDFIETISGRREPILTRISSTWVNDDGKTYGAYTEFDSHDEELLTSVRRWLTQSTGTIGQEVHTVQSGSEDDGAGDDEEW